MKQGISIYFDLKFLGSSFSGSFSLILNSNEPSKMLHLRKVGLSNIVFRNVTGLRSRAAHTTSDAEVFADDDEESKRVPRFEPVSEEGKVTFRLPDLSDREETFLKQQVRILLRPDCLMQQEPESGKCYFQSPSFKKARYPQFGSFSIEWPKLFRLVIRTKPMPSLERCNAGLSAANINLTFAVLRLFSKIYLPFRIPNYGFWLWAKICITGTL